MRRHPIGRVVMLVVGGSLGITPAASAAILSEIGASTVAGGTTVSQSFFDQRSATATSQFRDAVGNHGQSLGSLTFDNSVLTASAHGCAGGGPGFFGTAGSEGRVRAKDSFLLTAGALPNGTLVPVTFTFSTGVRVTAAETHDGFQRANAVASADTRVFLYGSATFLDRAGKVTRENKGDGSVTTLSGNFNPETGHESVTFDLAVGQEVTLDVFGDALGSAGSPIGPYADGEAQLAIVWGFDVGTAGAALHPVGFPDVAVPGGSGGSTGRAAAVLPPMVVALPEPAALGVAFLACAMMRRSRGRTRSTSA